MKRVYKKTIGTVVAAKMANDLIGMIELLIQDINMTAVVKEVTNMLLKAFQ